MTCGWWLAYEARVVEDEPTFLGDDWAAAVLLHASWRRRSSLVAMRKCKGRSPMPLGPLGEIAALKPDA